jgi:hypothetical protein
MVIGPYFHLKVRYTVPGHLSSSFSFCLAIPVNKYVLRPLLVLVLSRTLSIGLNWINRFVGTLPLLHLVYSSILGRKVVVVPPTDRE